MITHQESTPIVNDHLCDSCGIGYMRPTGNVLTVYPPKFPHLCNHCGHSGVYNERYPNVKHDFTKPKTNKPMTENQFSGLNKMAEIVYTNNKAKGFWDKERNVGETLMLIVTELAEAMEAFRRGNLAMPPLPDKELTRESFETMYKDSYEDEIADALIRILDLCGGTGIDLDFHVSQKVKYNQGRERLHGKAF